MLDEKIAQMNGEGCIVAVWDIPVSAIARATKICGKNISGCLSPNTPYIKSAGGYKWLRIRNRPGLWKYEKG